MCGHSCAEGQDERAFVFMFQAEDGIRDYKVTGVQTCALPIYCRGNEVSPARDGDRPVFADDEVDGRPNRSDRHGGHGRDRRGGSLGADGGALPGPRGVDGSPLAARASPGRRACDYRLRAGGERVVSVAEANRERLRYLRAFRGTGGLAAEGGAGFRTSRSDIARLWAVESFHGPAVRRTGAPGDLESGQYAAAVGRRRGGSEGCGAVRQFADEKLLLGYCRSSGARAGAYAGTDREHAKGGASAHSRLRVRRAARAGVGNHDPAQVERDVKLRSFLMRGARFSVPPWASAHGLTVIRRWRAEARHSTLKRAPRHALS